MVPLKVRAAAIWDGTTKANLFSKDSLNTVWRIAIHGVPLLANVKYTPLQVYIWFICVYNYA